MQLALHLSNLSFPGGPSALQPTLAAMARAADQGGFSTLTMMDHYFQMESLGGPAEPMLEGYTSLGYLAGLTTEVELGLLVTGVTYRHPGLLAKIISTLDVLSGGRAMLGIGAAWYEREHLGLGVPFPALRERYERLDEALRICRQMWSDDDGPFTGTHYQLTETVNLPAPSRRIPILIGGGGERKTLRLVAQHADACNLFPVGLDDLRHKLEVLDQHCADVGRDPAEIERTLISATDPLADLDAFWTDVESYAELGFTRLWVGAPADHPDPARWVGQVAEQVVPRLRDL